MRFLLSLNQVRSTKNAMLARLCLWMLAVLLIPLFSFGQDQFAVAGRTIDAKAFDQELEAVLQEIGIPAISFAIIEKNEIVYTNTLGYKRKAKKSRANKNTIFEACSLSKSFTTYVAYQLVDQGLLELDKPLYKYMEFPPLEHDERYKQITTRMVLSHSSGLENWSWFYEEDTLEILSNPGERFVYSGEGYHYLVRVINKLLGQSYDDYIDQRVRQPLGLRRTFTHYKKLRPRNFAYGHNDMGAERGKYKNRAAWPGSGNHLIAEDYAKLLIAMFDGKHLSSQSVKELVTPAVVVDKNNPDVHYGPGFEIIRHKNDTIIAHGGNNGGFKAMVFYSVTNDRGFVYFSNSDRGKLICSKLNEMTTQLDIATYFKMDYYSQYPSPAIDLLNVYYEARSAQTLYDAMERMKTEGLLQKSTLAELGDVFANDDPEISRRFLTETVELFPEYAVGYYLLGRNCIKRKDFEGALINFQKAEALNYDDIDLGIDIAFCKEKLEQEAEGDD